MNELPSRSEIRTQLASFLKGALGPLKLVKAESIYRYQVKDFNTQTPVVYLTSSGSGREALTGRGSRSRFKINIHVLVVYEDTEAGWTPENAEDRLDDLEAQIARVVQNPDTRRTLKWQGITYSGESNADTPVEIGGVQYLHEIIPVVIDIF